MESKDKEEPNKSKPKLIDRVLLFRESEYSNDLYLLPAVRDWDNDHHWKCLQYNLVPKGQIQENICFHVGYFPN